MLNEPGISAYDLQFRFLDIPVRIAWGFWLVAAILGWEWSRSIDASPAMTSPGAPILLLVWMGALFLSILVHEIGHCLAFRYYGLESRIVLYHFGGLAIPDSFGSWRGARQRYIGPNEQIVISAAGPALQLVLGLLTWFLGLALGIRMELTSQIGWLLGIELPEMPLPSSALVFGAFSATIFVSTIWSLLNLAPILPLDGGRIMESILRINRVDQPTRMAHMVSVGTGALLGIWFLQTGQPGGIMFLVFAASNWQAMQYGQGGF
ncbi:MAG: hypothetical protein KDB22_19330 [Planctomycetales bacterium]|nr:hypothetical protein [Planctomycetales bacterium]